MDASAAFRTERAGIVGHDDLVGAPFRDALSGAYDRWLSDLLPPRTGYALVAVGGLGRREVTEFSDLDLVLLHDGARSDIGNTADAVWYAVWDEKIKLDHSVRTVGEALDVARDDLRAVLGLLDARHIAGDSDLTRDLVDGVRRIWRTESPRRIAELLAAQQGRWEESGEAAFLLEPNLKESRGGLRDVHAMQAVAAAQVVDVPLHRVQSAYRTLLDVRGELHRVARRGIDQLVLEDAAAVAARLGQRDADALAQSVSAAARTIDFLTAQVRRACRQWLDSRSMSPRRSTGFIRRRADVPPALSPVGRTPLGVGVVEQGGEAVLSRDADLADPALVLRVAAAAAEHDLPINPYSLDRLAQGPPLPSPWPTSARDALVSLLGSGASAVPVLEALDQVGLVSRMIPEWEAVRFRPQRNPIHRYTVDRHLVETAVQAAALARRVGRPDLLLVGAFLHDIGKGMPGDHSVAGADAVATIAPRMGFPEDDVEVLCEMVRHHLLLPATATRRDPEDPATIATIERAVGGSTELLSLLAALSEADGLATGVGAWSEWKAGLVRALARRVRAAMAGEPLPANPGVTPAQSALADRGEVAVVVEAPDVTVVAPDQPGLLSRVAGVLALHRLEVHAATSTAVRNGHESGREPMAVLSFQVSPRFGGAPAATVLRADLLRVLAGDLQLAESLTRREAAYAGHARKSRATAPRPQARWVEGEATGAALLEVRCEDRIGLLHGLTAVLERHGLDISSARVCTLGSAAVDVFYVRDGTGDAVPDQGVRQAVARDVLVAAAGSEA